MSGSRSAGAVLLALAVSACASAATREGLYFDRIDAGFRKLGASEARSRCLSEKLSRSKAAADAVRIVESSTGREDMRTRVLEADQKTTAAFIRANMGCALAGAK